MLTASTLVVTQHAKFVSQRAEYDVHAPDGTLLGSMHQDSSAASMFVGQLATISYDVLGADGQLLMQIVKPGSIGRARFDVAWGAGQPIGSIEQENVLFAPQFRLAATDGVARLTGGSFGSWEWQLEDSAGQQVGAVTKEFDGLAEMFTSADRFVVQLGPQLTGGLRALAVAATVCLDEVRTAKRRR